MNIPQGRLTVQTILDELSSLPHRGAATANGAKAAERLKSYLATMGARVQAERFETPRTYATIVYWLLGGLLRAWPWCLLAEWLLAWSGILCGWPCCISTGGIHSLSGSRFSIPIKM